MAMVSSCTTCSVLLAAVAIVSAGACFEVCEGSSSRGLSGIDSAWTESCTGVCARGGVCGGAAVLSSYVGRDLLDMIHRAAGWNSEQFSRSKK